MCFEIGCNVAVLDDVIKGEVVAIKNDIVTIKDLDGMCYDFYKSELIVTHPASFANFVDVNNPLLQEKIQSKPKKRGDVFVKSKKELLMEVDLHIGNLIESSRGLTNYEMLRLQLNTAQQKIEQAIEKRVTKVVFIHGVGEGVLKKELYNLLNKYSVKYYDASYKKYGLGATEVYIYQNTN